MSRAAWAGIILSATLGIFLILWSTLRPTIQPVNPRPPQGFTQRSVEALVVAKDIDAYQVAPEMPRLLSISKIDARARILEVAQESSGAISAPKSIYDVGWYAESAKPGELGVTFIDGHVSGPTKPGVFKRLNELRIGDELSIERGDGELFQYHVTAVETRLADDINMGEVLRAHGRHTLVLMTCGGQFDRATQQYPSRVIVYAQLHDD